MDDAQTAVAFIMRFVQEASQQLQRAFGSGAVQVDFVLDRVLAALQATQDGRSNVRATEFQAVANIGVCQVERRIPRLPQCLDLIALELACPWFRARSQWWQLAGGQLANRPDGLAEQGGIVVWRVIVGWEHLESLSAHALPIPVRSAAIGYHSHFDHSVDCTCFPGAAPAGSRCSTGKRMHILVSNDDGVEAPGIRVLAEHLAEVATVTVVAPDRDRSGASNSLTLDQPIRVTELSERRYRVAGTPTDCVHLALAGMLEDEPDIVVSGINSAANLGDDVIYSGTVAAAMEGRFLGLPAIAVSLASSEHKARNYPTAARAAVEIMRRLLVDALPSDTILNVNVPDLPWSEIRGYEVTRLGHRHRAEPCINETDPRGRPIWWIGPAGAEEDAGPGTDFDAVRRGYISITPIHVDLTRYQALEKVASWVDGLAAGMADGEGKSAG